MNVEELRINNWVKDSDNGFPMQVVNIYTDTVCLDFDGNESDWWECKVEDARPILLTREWLDKIGLKYKNIGPIFNITAVGERKLREDESICLIDYHGLFKVDYNMYKDGNRSPASVIPVRYVHELQNVLNLILNRAFKRVYISGPITSVGKDVARTNFLLARMEICNLGYTPVSPFDNGLPDSASYEEHMQKDLQMLSECDCIYMLDGWYKSDGACRELEAAKDQGKEIFYRFYR